MENKMSYLDKMVNGDEWSTKFNKLNNDAKKIDHYIKKNNNIKKERDNLLLRVNQLNEEKNMLRNNLKIVEDKLNKASNDIDKKKLNNGLKLIKEELNEKNNIHIKKLDDKIYEKDVLIKNLNIEIKEIQNELEYAYKNINEKKIMN